MVMADYSKLPIVAYWVSEGPDQGLGHGYLMHDAGGVPWCLPDEDTARRQPSLVSGFQLDPQRLLEQPSTGADRKFYLYDADVDATPTGQGTRSVIRANFPRKGD
jgi:hypothetical protein